MGQTTFAIDSRRLEKTIIALFELFQKNNDEQSAQKVKQLAKKLADQEFSIALCGHFSAGKSTMINKIIGENLLPTSPIPTSANLVKVKTGDEYAKVYFKKENPRLYLAPYDFDAVKAFCKDGDQIESIEISHSTGKLPKNTCIMDTPGIDSTDDAHRIATESALHLADIILYVMDYNHVMSEVNFLFTKTLTDAGKNVYLIINQIDKHREEEIPFEHFKQGVADAFSSWGVKPAGIYYTSLKSENNPNNEFEKLRSLINGILSEKDELLPISIYYSLQKLIYEHKRFLSDLHKEEREKCSQILKPLSEKEQASLRDKVNEITQKLDEFSVYLSSKEKEFDEEIENILKNAYLMPFHTRELAERFLQSMEPDFKVGFLFTKQKTNDERNRRLEAFFKDYEEKVETQIVWHLKQYFTKLFQKENISHPELMEKAQGFKVPVSKDILQNAVKKGARLSGDYVLNYTGETAEAAKKIARQKAAELKAIYLRIMEDKLEEEKTVLKRKEEQYAAYLDAWNKIEQLKAIEKAAGNKMEQYLMGNFENEAFALSFEDLAEEKEEVTIAEAAPVRQLNKAEKKEEKEDLAASPINNQPEIQEAAIAQTAGKLKYAAEQLKDLPGFKKLSADLFEKGNRLDNQGFTVALFGAFSAGKSSFANALIGEKLLPVSPNPTTAAINLIKPADGDHPHGTVIVHVKEETVLLDDVNRSLSMFGEQGKSFSECLARIAKVMKPMSGPSGAEKTHLAFLKAFKEGFETFSDRLGNTIQTNLAEFPDFVAKEEKSCFVEMIEVYYDCELTRKGITLVDTPGADSINTRHTGVAFDYIKNSDAILFVTYYNHAFSKADREFLIQLGRVKESFEMDKMFFIINAVDLANTDEEREEVLEYVKSELIRYGIRNPSLYPVSSLLGLKEKLENNDGEQSGLKTFESRFYSFITKDLKEIALKSGERELERALLQLKNYIKSAAEDQEFKEEKLKRLNEDRNLIEKKLDNSSSGLLHERLKQEIEELVYYIKQRVFYRFSDFFKESFNPSTLAGDGRKIKDALELAMKELLKDIGFDFAQEFRATTLRVETFIKNLLAEEFDRLKEDIRKISPELFVGEFPFSEAEGPSFETAFGHLTPGDFRQELALFKSPKFFFEQNGRQVMADKLYSALQQPADEYVEEQKGKLITSYEQILENEYNKMLRHIKLEVKEYVDGMDAALKNETLLDQLMEVEKRLIGA